MFKAENDFNALLKRIGWINLFFFILIMIFTAGIFWGYDAGLIAILPKFDTFKVLFQSARFHLSTFAYLNIPVFTVILLFPALDAPVIPKTVTAIAKFYYISGFLALFSLQFSALVSSQLIPSINSDFIAQLITLFTAFDTKFLIIFIFFLSFILLSILIIFFFSVSIIIKSAEYEVSDRKKNIITMCALIAVCVLFARGGILSHISHSKHQVTPSIELNKYAQNGVYKTLYDIKRFNPANIKRSALAGGLADVQIENQKEIDEELEKLMTNLSNVKMLEELVK